MKKLFVHSKRCALLFIAIGLVLGSNVLNAQTEVFKQFPVTFSPDIPNGWKNLNPHNALKKWKVVGHYDGGLDIVDPRPGSNDTCFVYFASEGNVANDYACLWSEAVPLRLLDYELSKPVLSFWLHIPSQNENVPPYEFKVFCLDEEKKDTFELSTTIGSFVLATEGWEYREYDIPIKDNAKYRRNLKFGFYAKFTLDQAGGAFLDDITMFDRYEHPREVTAVDMTNIYDAVLPTGINEVPISVLKLWVEGTSRVLSVDELNFEYTGKDVGDITKYSLYYTRDSLFDPTIRLGETTGNTSKITFKNLKNGHVKDTLLKGKNFFWLCADIKPDASRDRQGNTVGVKLPINGIKTKCRASGKTDIDASYPIVEINPSSMAHIEESLYVTGFEAGECTTGDGDTQWKLSGDWEIGKPLGKGKGDPKIPYAGQNILATKLNANYTLDLATNRPDEDSPYNNHNDFENYARSPLLNALYFKSLRLHMARVVNIPFSQPIRVWIDGTDEEVLDSKQGDVQDYRWTMFSKDLPQSTRKPSIRMKVQIGETKNPSVIPLGGWNIDNFAITGDYIAFDAGIDSVYPMNRCGLDVGLHEFKVKLGNYGGEDLNTTSIPKFKVGYSLDGGKSFTYKDQPTEIKTTRDNAAGTGTKIDFTFDPVNLTPGLKRMVFKTFLLDANQTSMDEDAENDSRTMLLYVYPTIEGEYAESFEDDDGYWYPQGQNSSWEYGRPQQGSGIDTAAHGYNAWVTKLAGNHNLNERSYLESPCFKLQNVPYPMLGFKLYNQMGQDQTTTTPNHHDTLRVEYSVDCGQNWKTLKGTEASNWQDVGWTHQNKQTQWQDVYTLLPNDVKQTGVDYVKFRFVFHADSAQAPGVGIDQVRIYPMPYDIEFTADAFAPVNQCIIGQTNLTFTVNNIGHRVLENGMKLPISITVDNQPEVLDTITLTSNINKNGSAIVTTTTSFNIVDAGQHTIIIKSNLQPIVQKTVRTDSLQHQVTVTGMPNFSLGPDIGCKADEFGTVTINAEYNTQGVTVEQWRMSTQKNVTSGAGGFNDWKDTLSTTSPKPKSIAPKNFGYYAVKVKNGNNCEAFDTLQVINSTQDVQVSAITTIADACERTDSVEVKVTLKFLKGDAFGADDTFNVCVDVNGERKLTQADKPGTGWSAGGSGKDFTFKQKLWLGQPGTYNIRAYTAYPQDVDKSNDTSKITTNTWGKPPLRFNYPDTLDNKPLELAAICGDYNSTYIIKWDTLVTGKTWATVTEATALKFDKFSKKSCYYRVTLTDSQHSCGFTADSVYINTQDVGVTAVEIPGDSVCATPSGTYPITATISNLCYDDFPVGTEFNVTVNDGYNKSTQKVKITDVLAGQKKLQVPLDPMRLTLHMGQNQITVAAGAPRDVNSLNDQLVQNVTVVDTPTVNIPFDTLYQAFNEQSVYTIQPQYTKCDSFLWNHPQKVYDAESGSYIIPKETPNCSTANFTIYGIPAAKYKVTAGNGFCFASDSMFISSTDVELFQILSPRDTCSFERSEYPISCRIMNRGEQLKENAKVKIQGTYQIDGGTVETINPEEFDLSKMESNVDTLITLTAKVSGTASDGNDVLLHLELLPVGFIDASAGNNSKRVRVIAFGYPTAGLSGSDGTTITGGGTVTAYDSVYTIKVNNVEDQNFVNFKWYDSKDANQKSLSDSSTLRVNKPGTYALHATNAEGCSSNMTFTVNFPKTDVAVTELLAPKSACEMENVLVKVKVKNNSEYQLPVGKEIKLAFKINGGTEMSQTFTLAEAWVAGTEREFEFSTTTNGFVTSGVHSIVITVNTQFDRTPENDTQTFTVEHYASPVITMENVEFCDNDTITIKPTEITNNTGATYTWTTPDYNVIADSRAESIQTWIGGKFTLKVTNEKGCSAEKMVTVTKNPLPEAKIARVGETGEIAEAAICTGDSIHVHATVSGNSYEWYIEGSQEPVSKCDQVYLKQQGTYRLRVVSGKSCENSATFKLSLNPLPVVDLGEDQTICSGTELTLDAGNGGQKSYDWGNSENTTLPTTQQITVKPETTIKYWVKVVDNNNCANRDTVGITVNPSPKVEISGEQVVCPGKQTTLTGTSSIDGSTFSWKNQDETEISTETAITVGPGTYTLSVTAPNGCVTVPDADTVTQHRDVPLSIASSCDANDSIVLACETGNIDHNLFGMSWTDKQDPSFSKSTKQIVATMNHYYVLTVQDNTTQCYFKDSVEAKRPSVDLGPKVQYFCQGTTYTLKNLDETGYPCHWSSGETTKTIAVSTPGVYWLKVGDENSCFNTDTIELKYFDPVEVNITYSCDNEGMKLDAGNGYNAYQWETGETTQTIIAQGIKEYKVTITDGNQCQYTGSFTPVLPVVDLGADVEICPGGAAQLKNSNDLTDKYLWGGPDVTAQNQNAKNIDVRTPGTYWLRITDPQNCPNSDTLTLIAHTVAKPKLGPDQAACLGSEVTLDAGLAEHTYKWNTEQATQTITVAPAVGNHEYWVQVTDNHTVTNGDLCYNADTLKLTVKPNPTANVSGELSICQDGTTTLTAESDIATSFEWSSGQTTKQVNVGPGKYKVTATAKGCSTTSAEVTVTAYPQPAVDLGTDVSICQGTQHTFSNAHEAGLANLWSNGVKEPTITVDASGTFWLRVTDAHGCTNADTVILTVNPNPAFTFGTDTLTVELPYTLDPNLSADYTYLWSDNSSGPTLVVTKVGDYWLRVTDANGCSAADTVNIALLEGIGQISDINAQVVVFPNPTSQQLNVAINSATPNNFVIKIFAPNGRLVWQGKTESITTHLEQIAVQGYVPGVYLVHVSSQGHYTTLKVVVLDR